MPFSIAGSGSYLPPRIVTNEEVARLVGIQADRIRQLFDIEERRWIREPAAARPTPGQSVADLAAHATRAALDDAGLSTADVDVLIAVSTTPEHVSPPLDYRVRRKLGAGEMLGFTLHAACTGLYRAAVLADSLFAGRRAQVVAIVAADGVSQYFDFDPDLPKDLRLSMALYGDGAGAIVAVPDGDGLPKVDAITAVSTASGDTPGIALTLPFRRPDRSTPLLDGDERPFAYHDFRRVLDKGGTLTRLAADVVLGKMGVDLVEVDHVLTHQATGNLKRIAASLGLPSAKLHVNIENVGNTLSPSTLILFDQLKRRHAFGPAELLLMCSAESATWSYGGMAISWPGRR